MTELTVSQPVTKNKSDETRFYIFYIHTSGFLLVKVTTRCSLTTWTILRFSLIGAELSLNSAKHESLKHELGSILLSSLLAVSLRHSGRVSVSHTGDSDMEYHNLFKIILFLSLNSANSVKTFRENSIRCIV